MPDDIESLSSSRHASPPARHARLPVRDLLRLVRSQYFLVPQGTGIVAVLLHNLDYQFRGLWVISYVFWVATIVLLLGGLGLYAARLALFRDELVETYRTNAEEMEGLASISIAISSILQMAAMVIPGNWGGHWGLAIYGLWWANIALATCASMVIPFLFLAVYPATVRGLTPAGRLPAISILTASAACQAVCSADGVGAHLQIPAIAVAYMLVGMGLGLSLLLDALYLIRTLDQPAGVPPVPAFQNMILCGPWGQGAFALQALGQLLLQGAFAAAPSGLFVTDEAARPVGYVSILLALFSWGFATFWWVFAVLAMWRWAREQWRGRKLEMGLPAWSLIFPWGVYTNAAVNFGKTLDSRAFKVWSTALAVALVLLYIFVAAFTIRTGLITMRRKKKQGSIE